MTAVRADTAGPVRAAAKRPPAASGPGATPVDGYTARHLSVLEGLEAVRKRPGMYIGSTDGRGLMHCLWEIFDNAVDEALAGQCSEIDVVLHPDGSAEVRDNGLLAVGSGKVSVTSSGLEQYDGMARNIAGQVVGDPPPHAAGCARDDDHPAGQVVLHARTLRDDFPLAGSQPSGTTVSVA